MKRPRSRLAVLAASAAVVAPLAAKDAEPLDLRRQVEADWRLQAAVREPSRGLGPVTTAEDAAGACDGVKDGRWGFHTEFEERPWWQVDLGSVQSVARVSIYNRSEPGMAERAARLAVLLSQDGKTWREIYRHGGAVFYGAADGRPLAIPLDGAAARFLRLQLSGRTCFHLDEVEVYGAGQGETNLALGRPCDQSSVSRWSARKRRADPEASLPAEERWTARARALRDPLLDFERSSS